MVSSVKIIMYFIKDGIIKMESTSAEANEEIQVLETIFREKTTYLL